MKSLFQDCTSFAGPVDGDIDACLYTDLSTCSAYIGEECQYVGERLGAEHNCYTIIIFPQMDLNPRRVTSPASRIVKSGERRFSPLAQTSSSSLASPRNARCSLPSSRHAAPLEDLQLLRLWRNVKVGFSVI